MDSDVANIGIQFRLLWPNSPHHTRLFSPCRIFLRVNHFHGVERLSDGKMIVIQGSVAAGIAFWFAHHVIGHPQPFFAPMASVIALGTSSVGRLRRSVELVVGVALGIGIGDIIISRIGTGSWQIAITVACALAAALFLDKSPLAPIQATCSAVFVATIMPPGTMGGITRMIDALVGGLIGIMVIALVPNSAVRPARREVSRVIGHAGHVLGTVSRGMRSNDVGVVSDALVSARGTQARINAMIAAVQGGTEVAALSPFYWGARRDMRKMSQILSPVDNTMRNSRVLARRAATIISDQKDVDERIPVILDALAHACQELESIFAEQGKSGKVHEAQRLPAVVEQLKNTAAVTSGDHGEKSGVSGIVVMAQARSIIVDLLQVCGLSRESAVVVLRPEDKKGDGSNLQIWEG